jgi:hypothetical protein
MRQAVLDLIRQKAALAAVETAGQTLEFDVAEKLVRPEGNDSLCQQALLRPHLVSRVGALPFPSVPPLCPGTFKIAGLEFNRPWEPRWTVHPRANGDEDAHLQMHDKQQRDLSPTRVEIRTSSAFYVMPLRLFTRRSHPPIIASAYRNRTLEPTNNRGLRFPTVWRSRSRQSSR